MHHRELPSSHSPEADVAYFSLGYLSKQLLTVLSSREAWGDVSDGLPFDNNEATGHQANLKWEPQMRWRAFSVLRSAGRGHRAQSSGSAIGRIRALAPYRVGIIQRHGEAFGNVGRASSAIGDRLP